MATPKGNLLDVRSVKEFDTSISSVPVAIVHFWASWCEPCVHMDTLLRKFAQENSKSLFLRVEAEEVDELSERYNVSAVPFFLFFKNGTLVDKLEGASGAELERKVKQQITASAVESTSISNSELNSELSSVQESVEIDEGRYTGLNAPLRAELEKLLRKADVMLFMKGTPEAPRCGFSSKVVNALRETGVPYDSFDILSNEKVRQGLKELSDWPTFPQLYFKGELLGGCDIVLEMHASGELKKQFQGSKGDGETSAGNGRGGDVATGRGAESEGEKGGERGELKERLQSLINSSRTMLFMKGSSSEPKCGFSRKVVDALSSEGILFGSFDILTDPEVREGLKKLSDWPTYPQLFHRGELVGGCDIVLQLKQEGELKSTLSS